MDTDTNITMTHKLASAYFALPPIAHRLGEYW